VRTAVLRSPFFAAADSKRSCDDFKIRLQRLSSARGDFARQSLTAIGNDRRFRAKCRSGVNSGCVGWGLSGGTLMTGMDSISASVGFMSAGAAGPQAYKPVDWWELASKPTHSQQEPNMSPEYHRLIWPTTPALFPRWAAAASPPSPSPRRSSYWPLLSRQRSQSAALALAVDTPYGRMDSPTSSAREKCHQLVIAWHTRTNHRF
jgi:hypothetical protein